MIHYPNAKIKKCNYKEINLFFQKFNYSLLYLFFRGPKKLLSTTDTVTKRKGKKCHIKEDNNQATEIISLPLQSRRETRNSAKAAALRKQKVNSDEIIEDNKRKLKYVHYFT